MKFEQDSSDEIKIAIAVRRLTPSAERGDAEAFSLAAHELVRNYGTDIARKAMQICFDKHPKLTVEAIKQMPEDVQQEAFGWANEILAETLEDAGLRLEDHLRVSDQGIAVTKQAVAAIKATGYSELDDFGGGNDSLEGYGIQRIPNFWHPLSKTIKNNGEECLNSWCAVSLLISFALGWDQEGDPKIAKPHLQQLIFAANPSIDFERLCHRSRYDDRALLKLASLANTGFENLAKAGKTFYWSFD